MCAGWGISALLGNVVRYPGAIVMGYSVTGYGYTCPGYSVPYTPDHG